MSSKKKIKPVISVLGKKINAFALIPLIMKALREAGYEDEEIKQYAKEASSQGPTGVLKVSSKWVDLK